MGNVCRELERVIAQLKIEQVSEGRRLVAAADDIIRLNKELSIERAKVVREQ